MNYPYSTATGTIQKILTKIQSVGQPSKVDKKWFSSLGFTKSSEQRMIIILKFIGFAESNGTPTDLWQQFRSTKDGKKILGKALRSSYSDLFEIYPNASELENEELLHFFSTRTTAGRLVLSHTVNTFKNLANYAEFDESDVDPSSAQPTHKEDSGKEIMTNEDTLPKSLSIKIISEKSGLTINLNIQLTVPETTDEKVYDKLGDILIAEKSLNYNQILEIEKNSKNIYAKY